MLGISSKEDCQDKPTSPMYPPGGKAPLTTLEEWQRYIGASRSCPDYTEEDIQSLIKDSKDNCPLVRTERHRQGNKVMHQLMKESRDTLMDHQLQSMGRERKVSRG
jgi:hypothetical protein